MPSEAGPAKAGEVLDFWFGREGEPGYGEFREAWFTKDPEFDQRVRDRFEALHQAAAAGELDDWKEEARSCLALVILLDQLPRNMYRGDPRSYATDYKAQETAEHAVDRAFDRELPAFQRMFLYMPFMHSEDLAHQRRSVELFRALGGENDATGYAVRHMEIVERFGRFPTATRSWDGRRPPRRRSSSHSRARPSEMASRVAVRTRREATYGDP